MTLNAPAVFAFEKGGRVHCATGRPCELGRIEDIHHLAWRHQRDVGFVLPYSTIRSRGFDAHGDDPIRALVIDQETISPVDTFIADLPDADLALNQAMHPTMDDAAYADLVARFQAQAIETGEVAQATIARVFTAQLSAGGGRTVQWALYKRLLAMRGQYMTVLFDDAQGPTIIGATPERHLTITGNTTLMVPIAGTLRKEDRASFAQRLAHFIQDPKEINELFQVMDEEMKMMGRLCPEGGVISGPYLREVGAVVHTEYHLKGQRSPNTLDTLQHSLFAPTVVGSPLESAARQIKRFEPTGRGTYAGVIGVYRCPETDTPTGDLDTAIVIRCAELDSGGTLIVRAGGGIVRDSDPVGEARESTAKAQGFFRILGPSPSVSERFLSDADKHEAERIMAGRNDRLSSFWAARQNPYVGTGYDLRGAAITLVNNEDDFTFMIAHLLTHLRAKPRIIDTQDYDPHFCNADCVLIGPGPGDPNDTHNPRMVRLRGIVGGLVHGARPHFGVCLGHQMLALANGFPVTRQNQSSQGMPRDVMIDGIMHTLGFYNSFSPVLADGDATPKGVGVTLDPDGRVIVLRAPHWGGFQFHPESVMSKTGPELLYAELSRLLGQRA